MSETAKAGRLAERATAEALEMFGFRVLEMNRRAGHLELDIVAEREGKTVAVEVRSRAEGAPVDAASSVTQAKKRRVEKAARAIAHGGDVSILYAFVSLKGGAVSALEIIDESF